MVVFLNKILWKLGLRKGCPCCGCEYFTGHGFSEDGDGAKYYTCDYCGWEHD